MLRLMNKMFLNFQTLNGTQNMCVKANTYLLKIVKYKNTECCRPRSGLFRLLDNRFLPPPAKVKQTVDDLVLDEGGQFLDLPVNLALRLSTTLKDFLQMPYDYFCPTVKLRLSSRTCKTCGLYHASVKSLNRHIEKIHKKVNTPTEGKVRPVRVAARRANELMCIIQNLEHQNVEWLDESEVDIPKSDESEQTHNTEQQSNVIDNLESWIQVSWTEDC
nr:unnamed protein product [Callosobruchus chinensis]